MIITCIVLFFFALGNDILWVNYTIATSEKRPLRSAAWAFLIYLPVGIITPTLAHHPLFVFPLAAGAFVGTLLTVGWSRRKQRRANQAES